MELWRFSIAFASAASEGLRIGNRTWAAVPGLLSGVRRHGAQGSLGGGQRVPHTRGPLQVAQTRLCPASGLDTHTRTGRCARQAGAAQHPLVASTAACTPRPSAGVAPRTPELPWVTD